MNCEALLTQSRFPLSIFLSGSPAGTSDLDLQFIVLVFPTCDTLVRAWTSADMVKGVAQAGGQWVGGSVGTGLDFDGAVTAGGAALLRDLAVAYARRCGRPWSGPATRDSGRTGRDALFGVIDALLPLLLASDQVFHRAEAVSINFGDPFARLLEDGIADGSLAPPGGDPTEAAKLLFSTVCWAYVHLRGHHRWLAGRARNGLCRLITPGLVAVPGPGTRPAGL